MSNAIGIVGTDGFTPLYQPDGRWATWSIHEIYRGGFGQNKFIPKINDYVIEPETFTTYKVTDLNIVTYIPELTKISPNIESRQTDILLAETNNCDFFRVYFDKSVTPFTLAVDGMLKIYGSTASYARIYKGPFIDNTQIISRVYDNSGNFISHDITLSTVAFNTHTNFAIKSVPTCNTTEEELKDGEVVTIVIFDASGKVLSRRLLVVENTTYVAQAFNEQRYITQIFLRSPFISNTNSTEIQYPINLPLTGFNPIAVVQYNDGTQIEHSLSNSRFSLHGLDQFISSIIGHRVPLVLSYKLGPNEAALASVSSDGVYITTPYTLIVTNTDTSYNVKLFIFPKWIDRVNGYTFEAYLLNLDRNIIFNVTNKIYLASNSPSFNPLAYGITQRLIFNLDLSTVSGIFNSFLHTQTVDIILRAAPDDTFASNIWEVGTQIPVSFGYFGANLKAQRNNITQRSITIHNNFTTVLEFLNHLYYPTDPLINILTEDAPLIPSHIEVTYNDESVIKPIDEFNTQFTFNQDIRLNSNVRITFLRQSIGQFFKLSVAVLTVRL